VPSYAGTSGPQRKRLRSIRYGEAWMWMRLARFTSPTGSQRRKNLGRRRKRADGEVNAPLSVAALPDGEVAVATRVNRTW